MRCAGRKAQARIKSGPTSMLGITLPLWKRGPSQAVEGAGAAFLRHPRREDARHFPFAYRDHPMTIHVRAGVRGLPAANGRLSSESSLMKGAHGP